MSMQQQKSNLINWIESVQDESLLEKIISYKDLLVNTDKDWWQEIPERHKDSIAKGMQEAENDKVMSLEEFRKLYTARI